MKIELNGGVVTQIDQADLKEFRKHKWFLGGRYIARGKTKYFPATTLHRFILGAGSGEIVDHINHDKLDNRRKNLRKCDKSQNNAHRLVQRNSVSGYKGVGFIKGENRWAVRLIFRRKLYSGRRFKNLRDAVIAYNKLAKKYHGEYAVLNKVPKK